MRCLTDNDTGDKSWNSRKAAFVAFVKEMDPDVIGFQEGRVAQNEYLKSNLESSGWTYLAGTPAFKSGGVGKGYLPIAFKTSRFAKSGEGTFWLSNTPATESSVGGAGEKRICHWVKLRNATTGDDFVFACTHLDLNEVRNAQMQVILDNSGGLKSYIDDGTPLVLVGDMNCLETENTIVNAKKKLNDAFLVSQTTPTGPWRSFNGFTYREPASEITSAALLEKGVETRNGKTYSGNSRIDFVRVSKDIVVKSFACRSDTQGDVMGNGVNQYPSDHFPQLVELMMPTKGAAGGRFSVSVARSCPSIVRDARFVLTEGAGLDSADKIDFRLPHWVEGASVENGEIVISTQCSTDGLVITIR